MRFLRRVALGRFSPIPGDCPTRLLAGQADKGYFAEEKDLPVETLREAPPRGFFGGTDGTPMLVVVEMYAYPRPTVELVVPVT